MLSSGPLDAVVLGAGIDDLYDTIEHIRMLHPAAIVVTQAVMSPRDVVVAGLDGAGSVATGAGRMHDLSRERHTRARVQPETLTVLVVDDDDLVLDTIAEQVRRLGYRALTASGAVEALEILRTQPVQLLLSDIVMPGIGGTELLASARRFDPDLQPLVITGYASLSVAVEVLKAGGRDLVQKPQKPGELANALEAAATRWRSNRLARMLPSRDPKLHPIISSLSDREREVLHLVAWGFTSRDAGERLGLSAKTIDTYRERLMRKLDVESRAQLIRRAIELGLTHSNPP
jgi:DNA-binding NarL/FixJ family response regulator